MYVYMHVYTYVCIYVSDLDDVCMHVYACLYEKYVRMFTSICIHVHMKYVRMFEIGCIWEYGSG